jgi:zona occludens toxin
MPINAYTGLMGSGKSYECVTSVIVPAITAGRRVVTNVDGIDGDAIRAYCAEKWSLDEDKLGHVVHCSNDEVSKPSFLPHGTDVDTLCKPGDLIAIDEAWRFWGTDCKLLPEHKVFFREHRHYVHPDTKVSCDLVLMVQDISDLHRTLKVVVELTFRTTKLKNLGLNRKYRVEMWEGYKLSRGSRVGVQNKSYNKQIFPLYSSYSGGVGKEVQVDSRQNVLANKTLWVLVVFIIILGTWGFFSVKRFFYPAKQSDATTSASDFASLSAGAASQPLHQKTSEVSEAWRVSGSMVVGGKAFVVLAGDGGRVRLEHPSAFQNSGAVIVGDVDGQRITTWSGPQSNNFLSEAKK